MIRRESFFPVLLALLWGFNWPAIKIALSEIPPFVLRSIGLSTASLLLIGTALVLRRRLSVERSSLLPLLMAGSLNIAAFNIFVAFAQLSTTTSRAAVLTYTMPIWSVMLAARILREPIGTEKIIAAAVGALGIGLLALPVFKSGQVAGVMLPLLAALAWAFG